MPFYNIYSCWKYIILSGLMFVWKICLARVVPNINCDMFKTFGDWFDFVLNTDWSKAIVTGMIYRKIWKAQIRWCEKINLRDLEWWCNTGVYLERWKGVQESGVVMPMNSVSTFVDCGSWTRHKINCVRVKCDASTCDTKVN